jgi:hypothetical protein
MTTLEINTLQELAASRNLYEVGDIPNEYIQDADLFEHKIKIGMQEIPEFLKTAKGIETGLFYECLVQDKGTDREIHYIEHSYILIKASESDTLLMLHKDRSGKFYLSPYYSETRKFQDVSHYIRKEALKDLKEPNMVGVWSDKKLSDWISYCTEYVRILNGVLASVNQKNNEHEQTIETFIQNCKGCEVTRSKDGTQVWVKTNLFEVAFTLNRGENYLSKQIRFEGELSDVVKIHSLVK